MEDHKVKPTPNQSQIKILSTRDHDSIIIFRIGLKWNCASESSYCLLFVAIVLIDKDFAKLRDFSMLT